MGCMNAYYYYYYYIETNAFSDAFGINLGFKVNEWRKKENSRSLVLQHERSVQGHANCHVRMRIKSYARHNGVPVCKTV